MRLLSRAGRDSVYRSIRVEGYAGPLRRFTREQVSSALGQDLSVEEACDGWYSGACLMETLPSAVYILCQHGHDTEQAIIRAVNEAWDNDSVRRL